MKRKKYVKRRVEKHVSKYTIFVVCRVVYWVIISCKMNCVVINKINCYILLTDLLYVHWSKEPLLKYFYTENPQV